MASVFSMEIKGGNDMPAAEMQNIDVSVSVAHRSTGGLLSISLEAGGRKKIISGHCTVFLLSQETLLYVKEALLGCEPRSVS